MYCTELQFVADVLRCARRLPQRMCCSMLHCVAVCCSPLKCVADHMRLRVVLTVDLILCVAVSIAVRYCWFEMYLSSLTVDMFVVCSSVLQVF